MPLVRIDSPSTDKERLAATGDAVHAALIAAFGIPAADHFQVIRDGSHASVVYDPHYLGVERDDAVVFVQVFLRGGRSDALKREFYRELATRAAEAGLEPRNLVVVLTENQLADWSFGNGEAQYLDNPPGPSR